MIRDLDLTLKQLIIEELRHFGLNHPADYAIAFDPPTKKWSESPGADRVLNLYLYDVRENHDLRNNQPQLHRNPDGTVTSTQPPVRLDLHYLVTTWSLAATDKVLEEHRLLSQVAWAMLRHPYLIPAEIFDGPSPSWPPGYNEVLKPKTVKLPAFTAQPDSLEHLGEFWGTMENIWKPALVYVVTIPLDLLRAITGPMVTTKIVDYQHRDQPETRETLIQIGGRVFDATDPAKGIAGVAVYLQRVLFSVRLGLEGDLQAGQLSPEFRQEFQNHGISLSGQIAISALEGGRLWQIDDIGGGRTYLVRKTVDSLNIVQGEELTAVTDDEGRYTFVSLAAGTYTARARATGYQPGERTMRVPGPTEEYEFALEAATP